MRMKDKRNAERAAAMAEAASGTGSIYPENGLCPFCDRPMERGGPTVNDHHLVPKSKGGKQRHLVHRVCHDKIHATLTPGELNAGYDTFEALRGHPELAKFIRWVSKKDPTFVGRNK